MVQEKKYVCEVFLTAEEETTGKIKLTRKEYELVKWASNPNNWYDVDATPGCGNFIIYCPEIEEAESGE